MRISDWSSDVCSSDLPRRNEHPRKDHAALDIRIGRRFPREAHVLKALARTDASLPLARYLRRYCPQMAAENSAGRTRAYLFSPPPPAHSKNLLRTLHQECGTQANPEHRDLLDRHKNGRAHV